jgi:hypothetical protein
MFEPETKRGGTAVQIVFGRTMAGCWRAPVSGQRRDTRGGTRLGPEANTNTLWGLDASGKSTCTTALAKHSGAELLPPTVTRRAALPRRPQRKPRRDPGRRVALLPRYPVRRARRGRRAAAQPGRSTVLSRYFLPTQAYATFEAWRLEVDEVSRLLRDADVAFYRIPPSSRGARACIVGERARRPHRTRDD